MKRTIKIIRKYDLAKYHPKVSYLFCIFGYTKRFYNILKIEQYEK